jgi:hypothetical protein
MANWEKAHTPLLLYQGRLRDISRGCRDSKIPHRLREEFVRYEHWFWEACTTYPVSISISWSDVAKANPLIQMYEL